MLKAHHKKSPGARGRIVTYICLYSIISATLLIINKAAVVRFPYPNTVLLLQLASSAAFAALLGKLGLAEVDELSWSNIAASIPVSVSFFLGVFTSINALHHVNVDTMIVLKTATPIMVAVGEWLCLSYAMPSLQTWVALSCVVMTTAASLSMQFSGITTTGLVWVVSWFTVVVFNMVYSSYYVQTVKLTAMGRVLCENLIAAVPAAALAAVWEWSPQVLPALWSSGGLVVLVSCLFGFGMSWFGWALRQEVSALTYTVVGVLTKLITVVLNATMWDRHGPAGSSFLLALGICASSLYQQPPKLPKQKRGLHQRLAGILAGLVGTLLLVRAGLALGARLYGQPVVVTLDTTLKLVRGEGKVIMHQMDVERQALVHQLQQFAHLGNPTYATQTQQQQRQQRQQLRHRLIHLGGSRAAAGAAAGVAAALAGASPQLNTDIAATAAAAEQDSLSAAAGGLDASPAALVPASPAATGLDVVSAAPPGAPITPEEIVAAAQQPIRVALMTGTFFGIGHGKPEPNCTYQGVPLDCRVQGSPTAEYVATADALYYHIPSHGGDVPPRSQPKQLRLAVDLEPAAYYRHMNDPNYMCQFDAEFTYRLCSQVVNFYSLHLFGDMGAPPVPWEEKEHALVYINSNCGAMSGRATIMKELMALQGAQVPVHSMGNCDRNMDMPPGQNKLQTFAKWVDLGMGGGALQGWYRLEVTAV